MNYLTLPFMDSPVSFSDICQAHQQLESDYNVGGIVRERPSNRRRNASTSVQLHRMKFSNTYRHVDIVPVEADYVDYSGDSGDEDVRDIYLLNVLQWGLPMDEAMRAFIGRRYTQDFLEKFESWRSVDLSKQVPQG
jgi:hypothetical protein